MYRDKAAFPQLTLRALHPEGIWVRHLALVADELEVYSLILARNAEALRFPPSQLEESVAHQLCTLRYRLPNGRQFPCCDPLYVSCVAAGINGQLCAVGTCGVDASGQSYTIVDDDLDY